MPDPKTYHCTATELNDNSASLLTRVSRGETVVISRWGKPVAVIQPWNSGLAHTPLVRGSGKL